MQPWFPESIKESYTIIIRGICIYAYAYLGSNVNNSGETAIDNTIIIQKARGFCSTRKCVKVKRNEN